MTLKSNVLALATFCLVLSFEIPESGFLPAIGRFEGLNYPALRPPPSRSKRDLDKSHSSFTFHAFGYNFTLLVYRDKDVISPTATVLSGGQSVLLSDETTFGYPVRGFLKTHPRSLVFGTVLNGLFRGTIALNASNFGLLLVDPMLVEDVYFVEPAGNYLSEPDFHSVIYRANQTTGSTSANRKRRNSPSDEPFFCGHSNPNISRRLREFSEPVSVKRSQRSVDGMSAQKRQPFPPHSLYYNEGRSTNPGTHFRQLNSFFSETSSRLTRAHDAGPTSRVCNLYLQSDTFLWDHVIRLPHIRGSRDLAIQEIASIFTQHVQGAQALYQYTTFKDVSGRLSYRGVGFRVDRVLINVTDEDCHPLPAGYSPTDTLIEHERHRPPSALPHRRFGRTLPPLPRGSYRHQNPFCSEYVDVTNFLNLNSYVNHDDFCLAYVFTYRDFTGGTLGLAWVAELGGSGGVCEKHRLMREGSQTVKKSLNTGVVTLLNYGARVSMKISQLTFAHEMGHNLGAKHDDDFKEDAPACLPSVDDPKGNYIMFASATGGDKENNNKFSTCSIDSIARLLNQVLKSESNCFFTSNGSFCGNRLTEEGEQCDCGFTREDCDDVCCYPKDAREACRLKKFANAGNSTVKVHCSPNAGECCTSTCQYRDTQHLCRGVGECHKASFCSGDSAQCPAPENTPDGTPCKHFTKICRSGECVGSVCERIPGWQECSLTRGEDVTPELMCYVACRENRTGAPCISTLDLATDATLRQTYPRLASELLQQPGSRPVRLQPGTPCDNYRGYCDVYFVCRSVQVEGPLARLHNLLFSPQVLSKVKTWITVHWWAMLLISFTSVASMIIFMRLCSYRTPSARSYHPREVTVLARPRIPRFTPDSPEGVLSPSEGQQCLPREHFVPSFRCKRQRMTDSVGGIGIPLSERIPASSIQVPYHRSRGNNRTRGHLKSNHLPRPPPRVKSRPVSVVVYPQPVLPTHARDLPFVGSRNRSQRPGAKRPLSFVVIGSSDIGQIDGHGDSLLPPLRGSPPPVYTPSRTPDRSPV